MKRAWCSGLLAAGAAAATAAMALAAAPAAAQTWPARPIRIVVPFTPGSGTDVIARAVSDKLGAALGQSVLVENKPGAGGTVGAGQVAKADADGYTLLVHSSGHAVSPAIYASLPYDPAHDFAGVALLAALPNVLVVAPSSGLGSVADLVARAKQSPGKMNYGSAGNGSATHLNAAKFALAAGIEATHVPYKGTPEAITDVTAGRVEFFFAPLVSALPLIKDGRLKALAVGTPQRSSLLPDVPTTVEAGVAGSEYTFWVALFAPARTPRSVVERLHAEVQKAQAQADLKERYAGLGAEPGTLGPAQLDAMVRVEIDSSARIVKAAGLKPN
jgi:tripartite-type tricarboxylate transporter receptor subunit TctC